MFRVRVDLKGSRPPIWRRLEVRSDLTLDVIHRILQAAFSWTDTHLWRFSLGGDPFDRFSQLFLCQWDVDEGELDDDGGIPATEVRLDETLQEPNDVLAYAYDYGDGWELRLRLEEVHPPALDAPLALVVDGRRAAPPEDCGGVRDGEGLDEILDDPEEFDLDATNVALHDPSMVLTAEGFDRRLADLVYRLGYTSVGEDLGRRALTLVEDPGPPSDYELRTSFNAFMWFLDRAADGGIPLTAAGYLKPIDVQGAAQALPTMAGWIGKANRENETTPVLHFRKLLQSLGLMRKRSGKLVLTRAGAAAQQAPEELWNHLADKLATRQEGFEADGNLLLLAYAATSAGDELPLDEVADALTELGWRAGERGPIERRDLYWLRALEVMTNVAGGRSGWHDRWRISPAAAKLARAALRRSRHH
jgi:hypothetical protein